MFSPLENILRRRWLRTPVAPSSDTEYRARMPGCRRRGHRFSCKCRDCTRGCRLRRNLS
ncbi:hypothetical protein BDP27DRAFT_1329711 [Rhodocollybia butyracea]|uniref:Uncharacterized protein n=1 Tax=Rhodocollybia butyracea TaxID=206335 RepID=A0A9P5PS17_9AGAR|nr:hypothetical protein BDP27DRAFT_1329711 [Rhodocollybia butyracea]